MRTKRSTSGRSAASRSSGASNGASSNGSSRRTSRDSDWSSGVIDLARERPIAAAAVAAGAAAAGLFLWSKRSQITSQLSNLSDQIGEWKDSVGSDIESSTMGDDTGGLTTGASTLRSPVRGRSTARGISETGGGNATLGRVSGGAGTSSSASGRGRAQSTAAIQE